MSKKFIEITNNTPTVIAVIPGIMLVDRTNIYSPVRDRLNVQPAWVKMKIKLNPGVGLYPLQVKDWEDVKSLAKLKKLTIGQEYDASEVEDEELLSAAEEMDKALTNAMERYQKDIELAEKVSEADKNRKNAD